eukprot:6499720-Lingulodinium_polyedra.AAC.1
MEGEYYDSTLGKVKKVFKRKRDISRGVKTTQRFNRAVEGINKVLENLGQGRDAKCLIERMQNDMFRNATDW